MSTLRDWIEWARRQPAFDYEGYRFPAPFRCMCCGVETSPEQWAYGRTCGPCDTGICQRDLRYAHDRPPWSVGNRSRAEAIRRYAEAVGGVPLVAQVVEIPPAFIRAFAEES